MGTTFDPLAYNTQLQAILSDYQAKKAALLTSTNSTPANPAAWNAPPPRDSQIREFTQSTSDVLADAPQTARPIGDLTGGVTRLNLVSALTRGDSVDFFSFNLTTPGNVGMAVTSDLGVHVQLLNKNGTVIADSEATTGSKADNYKALAATKLNLSKDTYFLKVTRSTGALNGTQPNYALQLSMGRYFTQDYTTTETPAAPASASLAPVSAQAAANITDVLQAGAGTGSSSALFNFII